MIQHLTSPQAARRWCDARREINETIGFVATMGALHPGHLSLVGRATEENDRVIVSIFVNPLQFNNAEDLEKYPRNETDDIAQLDLAGVDAVFTGTAKEFLGKARDKSTTQMADPGIYARGLEGTHRPGHFAGVREIVSRLFEFVGPCRAYFGEKDYQQLQVIKQLAAYIPGIIVISCRTSRETSGLARSSRNSRLSARGTSIAANIFKAMQAANTEWKKGCRTPAVLQKSMLRILARSKFEIEYAEIRDPLKWTETQPDYELEQARVFVAGIIEGVRLIDNLELGS